MINKKQVVNEIERLDSMKILVQAYEEIAATRIKKIRGSVLESRDFLFGLNQIFREVQTSYRTRVKLLMKKKKFRSKSSGQVKDKAKLSLINKNGKAVSVLISANTGLYGDIVKKTFNLFIDNVKNSQTDVVIIGKIGRILYEEKTGNLAKAAYFDFSDSSVEVDKLKKIVEYLVQYEKIAVFYGQFKNVVNQTPTIAVISDTDLAAQDEKGTKLRYFFEPSLEKIMVFFETEIFASIFEQTIHESQLAKFSSRMITLDKAIQNIKGSLKKVEYQKRVIHHRSINRKQLESLAGISLWRK